VIDGLPADVVALALPLDVQKIADAGLLRQDWRKMYPLQSVGACVCVPACADCRVAGSWPRWLGRLRTQFAALAAAWRRACRVDRAALFRPRRVASLRRYDVIVTLARSV
jgi:hypothetical protein